MTLAQAGIKYDVLTQMEQGEIKVFKWKPIGEIYIQKLTDYKDEDIDNGYGAWFPQMFPREDLYLYQWKYGTQYFLNNLRSLINNLIDFHNANKSLMKLTNGWVYNNTYYQDLWDILDNFKEKIKK